MIIRFAKLILPARVYTTLRAKAFSVIRSTRALIWIRQRIYPLRGIKIDMSHELMTPTIKNAILSGTYESHESSLVKKFVKPDDIILELGAGIGYITMVACKITGPERVYSFEANRELEPLLRRNFSLNNFAPKLTIAILGKGNGEEKFYVDGNFWASSLVANSGKNILIVPRIDLNDAIQELNPTVLICDIEGGEVGIVFYMIPHTIRTIIMECHPNLVGMSAVSEMLDKLSRMGFVQRHRSFDYVGSTLFQYVGSRIVID